MYVGSTELFGFINYLVCPIALILGQRPTGIAIAADGGGFVVEADVAIPIQEGVSGRLAPFEDFLNLGHGKNFEAAVLSALSETLTVAVEHEHRTETLTFRHGARESRRVETAHSIRPRTTLRFVPDRSIFTATDISPTIFTSYLRRLSFLHQGIRFAIALGEEKHEYYSERGVVDLFASVAAPYQLLHEPIHIVAEDGHLRLEAVFAFHSWTENGLWCFINNGRAVEGGTHEQGLHDALDQLCLRFQLPKSPIHGRNGVVSILSIHYPEAVWEGCIKAKIGNPELRVMVCNLVFERASEWLESHSEVAEQLRHLETFQFPDVWYGR